MEQRFTLTDPDLLRKLMKRAPGGPLAVRDLAKAAGVSKSKIGGLLTGVRPGLPALPATLIAETVEVHRAALFTPITSTFVDADTQGGNSADRDSRREEPANEDRCP